MNYLLAFDKFKGSITSSEACDIARGAILSKDPAATIVSAPLTDGGEGFASVIALALAGDLRTVEVTGPRFRKVQGRFAMVDAGNIPAPAMELLQIPNLGIGDKVAFVEMASASGYEHLTDTERDPWKTTTFGTGELLASAAEAGASAIVLGIGGSATNDCGAGALEAMGVAYYDRTLNAVTEVTPERFKLINTLGSTSHLVDSFPPVRIACDVTNPLLGEQGATRVFGRQKGLKPEDFDRMERTMRKMGSRLLGLFGRNPAEWEKLMAEPGSGAAGGIGFALRHALPDSRFVEGFALVSEILCLKSKMETADMILTGEGGFDGSSLSGKGPFSLLQSAGAAKKVRIYCGVTREDLVRRLASDYPELSVITIRDKDADLAQAIRDTATNLNRAVAESIAQTS